MDNNLSQIQNDEAVEQNIASEETVTESVTSDTTPDLSAPLEQITPKITYTEMLEHHRHVYKRFLHFTLYVFILSVAWTIYNSIRCGSFAEGGSGSIVAAVMLILMLIVNKSIKINAKAKLNENKETITYSVFYNRIEYEYRIGDDLYNFYRIDPKKITKAKQLRHTIIFIHEGIQFMVPKSAITSDSLLFKAVFPQKKMKKSKSQARDKRQTAIIWLIASAVTVLVATVIISIFAPIADIPFAILSFLSIALPIVSLAFIGGWRARGKGLIIFTCIVLIIALFASFVVAAIRYDEVYVDEHEAMAINILDDARDITNIDFPEVYDVYLNENEYYDPQTRSYITYTYFDCSLSYEDNKYLRSQVEGNNVWISEMSEEMAYFVGNIYSPYDDPFIIVNLTEGTYNQLPSTNNKCEYVIISYDYSNRCIDIYAFSKASTTSIPSTPGSLMA